MLKVRSSFFRVFSVVCRDTYSSEKKKNNIVNDKFGDFGPYRVPECKTYVALHASSILFKQEHSESEHMIATPVCFDFSVKIFVSWKGRFSERNLHLLESHAATFLHFA